MPRKRRYRRTRSYELDWNAKYLPPIVKDFAEYLVFLRMYGRRRMARLFFRFEKQKDRLVDMLYRRRGKYARPFVHSGLMGLLLIMVTAGPLILSADAFSSELDRGTLPSSMVLGATSMDSTYEVGTIQSSEVAQFRGGEIIEYAVQEGDTVSSIGEKFGVSQETILWENNLSERDTLKVGQKLRILPVTGIMHTVKKGETIYSIAKKYGLEDGAGAQPIVNYPFNEFVNDEKFTIAVGQNLMIPGGVKPQEKAPATTSRSAFASTLTPDRGTVSAIGSFVWPASGRITQGYSFYHKALDIANHSGGAILAADAGTVIVAGWPDNSGYGNRVMIDHGNGYVTLYGHLSSITTSIGRTVNRGDIIGYMGSTGRSTGTHLHFEIRHNGVGLENPLNYLQ